ncbi:MAG: excinuclease ABC subunit UvrC [Chloroflexota bacterium]|nr:excinuclease ABC subunit UvrC [Chloroflexota bacterium]
MKTPAKQSLSIPSRPGVYLFRNAKDIVIYVGKAANLHNRVRSYFVAHPDSPKLRQMVPLIADIDFIITDSEQEAIILENNLIKKHKPHYNVRLKDDKSYPYLKITLADEWPRAHLTRRLADDGSRYFGPFASASALRQTMTILNKLFPYRTCRKAISGTDARPCLKYHIKRCSGPCIGAVSRDEYREIIANVILFLEGKHDSVIRGLKQKMKKASARLEFERAAQVRDQIAAIESILEQQKVVSSRKIDEDVIAIARGKSEACAQVFFIRSGKLQGEEHFVLEGTRDENPDQVVTSFIEQFYGAGADIPAQLLLQMEPQNTELIQSWLESKRGRRVRIRIPRRGEKKKLVDMVAANAAEVLEQLHLKWLADTGKTAAALEELKAKLNLPRLPRRMECYDISNIRGTAAVGSMVVFEDGQPRSAHYRRFKIKTVSGIDDYAMMREVLWRRFAGGTRTSNKGDEKSWALVPDLIVIDGGRGHLNAIRSVMQQTGVESIPVASIAKENEEVFIPELTEPVILPKNSQALYLLQRIRDEAHRFAISYHTRMRHQSALTSVIDEVPGIGPTRKRAMLKKFGSLKAIKEASIDEMALVPGMTTSLAKRIKEYL